VRTLLIELSFLATVLQCANPVGCGYPSALEQVCHCATSEVYE
jgi:hypothetical protein